MLDRVMVHQPRLRTPGLGLDARGVALGSKGLALLPSLDRLVAFLALTSGDSSLAETLRALEVEVVKSKLGAREVAVAFPAGSSERMDRVADAVKLAGGYLFTGSARHFVQFRDAASPFGYDTGKLGVSDAPLVLHHSAFAQGYEVERKLDLRSLLARLELRPDPQAGQGDGPKWASAEGGLGPALVHYLVRSGVEAEVGVVEWPPASSFDEGPVRRYLFRIPRLPERMRPLLCRTPGLTLYEPEGPAAAVEVAFAHPVRLRACGVFSEGSLTLFRGRREEPFEVASLPQLGPVSALARVGLLNEGARPSGRGQGAAPHVRVGLKLFPSLGGYRNVTAAWLRPAELPLLRHLVYALGREALQRTRIALTAEGAFLRSTAGVEGIPLGLFFGEIHPNLYLPVGFEAIPAVSPEVLAKALEAPRDHVLFLEPSGRAVAVPSSAFQPLEAAVLEGHAWAPLTGTPLDVSPALSLPLPQVDLGSLGFRPMRDVAPLEGAAQGGPAGDE